VTDDADSRIRVLIADDHAILRDGIRALLEDEPDIDVVGEAEDGRWAVERACKLRPDVVLMDIAMPLLNGLEATRQIKRDTPETHVLILTMYEDAEYVGRVLEAGASGYVLKHAAGRELVTAIRAVADGGAFFSPSIARHVLEGYVSRRDGSASPDPYDDLTPREREVLQLIAEGHTNRDIAEILTLSIKTVKTHRLHLMQKLDIHDRGELIKYAIQKGIIQP
jgi:DNA-binding NarL/FixJ family response regulator